MLRGFDLFGQILRCHSLGELADSKTKVCFDGLMYRLERYIRISLMELLAVFSELIK